MRFGFVSGTAVFTQNLLGAMRKECYIGIVIRI